MNTLGFELGVFIFGGKKFVGGRYSDLMERFI